METLLMIAEEEAIEGPGLGMWLLGLVVGTVVNWVVLMVVIPIAQRLGDFGTPPFVEMAWKLALVVLATNVASDLTGLVNPWLGWGVGLVVFWTGMAKVLDLDFFGACMIVLVSWLLRNFLMFYLMSALA